LSKAQSSRSPAGSPASRAKLAKYGAILDAFAGGLTYLQIAKSMAVGTGTVMQALRWGRSAGDPRAAIRNPNNTAEARTMRQARSLMRGGARTTGEAA
jgi:hypothetical protein